MANEKDLENLIEKKFMTQEKFSNYIDAVVFYCEENEIEIEKVSKLISKPLKEKLRCEALDLNFLKKTSRAKLPL